MQLYLIEDKVTGFFLRFHNEWATEWVMSPRFAGRMSANEAASVAKKLIALGFAVTFKGDNKV